VSVPTGGFILAIDQGAAATTAALVDSATNEIVALSRQALSIEYPQPGWVQQDADEMWETTVAAVDAVFALAPGMTPATIALTNQREAAVAWNRHTGEPWGPVLSWQDARTAPLCAELADTAGQVVRDRTGLALDPLYSAPKMRWLLDYAIDRGAKVEDICLGTVDA
jgi:glycerol kinase